MLFLTDVDHVSFEKANETRQNNLPSATVSNGRVKLSALRRLFSFAVVRQSIIQYLIQCFQ